MDIDEEAADEHDDSDPLVLSSDEEEEDEDPQAGEDSDPWADEDDLEGAFSASVGGRASSPPSTRRTTRSRAGETKSLPTSASPEPGTSTAKAAKGKGKATTSLSSSKKAPGKSTTKDIKLSADQKEECEKMFQQFFSSNDKSKNRAITMADIRYVATLLNEKISDADVVEMLEFGSNTGDKTVTLEAFFKIMVDVKAV